MAATSASGGIDGVAARSAFTSMSDAAITGWMDALENLFVTAHENNPDPRKCRFRIPELLMRDELPKFTQDPKSAGNVLKNDGRFHKFGKRWGLLSLVPGGDGRVNFGPDDEGGGGGGATVPTELGPSTPVATAKRGVEAELTAVELTAGEAISVGLGAEDRPAKKSKGEKEGKEARPKKERRKESKSR